MIYYWPERKSFVNSEPPQRNLTLEAERLPQSATPLSVPDSPSTAEAGQTGD